MDTVYWIWWFPKWCDNVTWLQTYSHQRLKPARVGYSAIFFLRSFIRTYHLPQSPGSHRILQEYPSRLLHDDHRCWPTTRGVRRIFFRPCSRWTRRGNGGMSLSQTKNVISGYIVRNTLWVLFWVPRKTTLAEKKKIQLFFETLL